MLSDLTGLRVVLWRSWRRVVVSRDAEEVEDGHPTVDVDDQVETVEFHRCQLRYLWRREIYNVFTVLRLKCVFVKLISGHGICLLIFGFELWMLGVRGVHGHADQVVVVGRRRVVKLRVVFCISLSFGRTRGRGSTFIFLLLCLVFFLQENVC